MTHTIWTNLCQYKGMIPTSYINGCTKYYVKIARGVILMRFNRILFTRHGENYLFHFILMRLHYKKAV